MTTIAVLGAKGQVARTVAKTFHRAGYRVITVSRNPAAPETPTMTEHRQADALNRDALIAATTGADIIFNGLNPPYTAWETQAVPMSENVIAAAKANGATHLFPGNVYNFGREIPETVDETTPMVRSTGKARIRIEMEERMHRSAENDGVQTLILRAGDFYGGDGDGQSSWFSRVLTAKLDLGVFTYPGPLDRKHAWAYLPDLASAFVALADQRERLDRFAWFGFQGHCLTGRQMKKLVEAVVERDLKDRSMPWRLLRLIGIVHPMFRELAAMSYLWSAPHCLSNDRLTAAIGPLAETPPEKAVRTVLGRRN